MNENENPNPLAKFTELELTKELRRRRLLKEGFGTISIDNEGQVSLKIEKLEWPVGEFRVKFDCLEDLTVKNKEEHEKGESNG